MADPKHPIHDIFSPQPGDAGVENSIDQRPRDGRTQGIDQGVGESVGTPRVTEDGIEKAPLEGEQI